MKKGKMFGFLKRSAAGHETNDHTKKQRQPECSESNGYEKKRKEEGRSFRREWQKEFPWLQYDETNKEMFCEVCQEFPLIADKSSAFFSGNKAFHIANIRAHAKNRKHWWTTGERSRRSDFHRN